MSVNNAYTFCNLQELNPLRSLSIYCEKVVVVLNVKVLVDSKVLDVVRERFTCSPNGKVGEKTYISDKKEVGLQ